MIKQNQGDQGFLNWKIAKAQERINREQYRRTMAFQASIELEKLGRTKMPEDLARIIGK